MTPFWLPYGSDVPTLTLKNLSRDLHRKLKARAVRHGRSLNSEAIACLRSVLASEEIDVDALLSRARAHRDAIGAAVSDAEIRTMKRAGRA